MEAATEPSGSSSDVSHQRELRELESGFAETEDTALFQNQAEMRQSSKVDLPKEIIKLSFHLFHEPDFNLQYLSLR
jgi:hypothetical protein